MISTRCIKKKLRIVKHKLSLNNDYTLTPSTVTAHDLSKKKTFVSALPICKYPMGGVEDMDYQGCAITRGIAMVSDKIFHVRRLFE
jgi:hypothetical protein